ncbi:MAG TPA: tRNA-dihydrouridine synthase [Phycisphaerae bacterium]|nr:tRNA-dihydrouridine synthase [Phycisphaerae bacterium]
MRWAFRLSAAYNDAVLTIGPLQFDLPVVQAALAGYSDAPMRRIARRLGAPYALREVVLDKIVIQPGKRQRETLALSPDDHPIGGQLMGSQPEQIAEAAEIMARSGFDVIDLNFACPVKKVLGRCRGGYLLSDPQTAIDVLRRVRDALPAAVPLTLKLRRGMDDSAESECNFFQILDAALEMNVAAVTVHPRTVRQRYVGPSDWSFLARVKRYAGQRTIIGSGDLFTAEDIAAMFAQTGVDGVSIARGCIGNPWIFNAARALLRGDPAPPPPSVAEQGRVIREHYALATAEYGERRAPAVMRKFGIKYAELHPFYREVRDDFVRSGDERSWSAILDHWYDPTRVWPPAREKKGPGALIAAGARQ